MSFVLNFLRRYGIVTEQQPVERDPDHIPITSQNLRGRQRGAGLPDALLRDGDNDGGHEEEGTHGACSADEDGHGDGDEEEGTYGTGSADEDGDDDEDQGTGKRRRRAESTERSTGAHKRRRYQSPEEDNDEEVEEEYEHEWIPNNPPLWAECPVCFEDKICGWRRSCNCAGFCSWRCGWTAIGRWGDGEQAETTDRPPAPGISKLCSYCGQTFDFVHGSLLTSGVSFVAREAEVAAGWRRRS